jgi:hypothetical protein
MPALEVAIGPYPSSTTLRSFKEKLLETRLHSRRIIGLKDAGKFCRIGSLRMIGTKFSPVSGIHDLAHKIRKIGRSSKFSDNHKAYL